MTFLSYHLVLILRLLTNTAFEIFKSESFPEGLTFVYFSLTNSFLQTDSYDPFQTSYTLNEMNQIIDSSRLFFDSHFAEIFELLQSIAHNRLQSNNKS